MMFWHFPFCVTCHFLTGIILFPHVTVTSSDNEFDLALTVLVMTIDALRHFEKRVIAAQCEGMGEIGSARYEPALLPSCPSIRVLCYSNCQRSTQSHQLILLTHNK